MIVKILRASAGFEGIDYNDRKTKNGKGELLEARNFGLLEMKAGHISKEDYIAFMQMYSESNARVKNKQFHAVISCKGKAYTAEQLQDFGNRYLEKMGYSNNPYLIYFHSDTANNHVHVVSTRVDENGLKVNDSHERPRSQAAMKEILGLSPEKEYQSAVEKAFGYSFSSESQFKLLLEGMGYQIKEAGTHLEIIKYKSVQGKVSRQAVAAKLQGYVPDSNRIRQVTALFNKYKSAHSASLEWKGTPLPGGGKSIKEGRVESAFSAAMAKKFGLELVFHQKDGKVPYGYTIIDHSIRQVHKGSQVMGLADLLKPVSKADRIEGLHTLVSEAKENRLGFLALKELLSSNGYSMDRQGNIGFKGTATSHFQLEPADLEQFKYRDRLTNASLYEASTIGERHIIAHQYNVQVKDVPLREKDADRERKFVARVQGIIQHSSPLKEGVAHYGLRVLVLGKEVFVHDQKNSIVMNVKDLLPPPLLRELEAALPTLDVIDVPTGNGLLRETAVQDITDAHANHPALAQNLASLFGAITDDQEEKRKKRKR